MRIAADLSTAQPGLAAERISRTILFNAGADQIVAARGIAPSGPVSLVGAIGRAALAGLLPPGPRWRLKARARKRGSKYTFTTNKHPRTSQAYTLDFEMIKDGNLDSTNTSQTHRCCTQRDATFFHDTDDELDAGADSLGRQEFWPIVRNFHPQESGSTKIRRGHSREATCLVTLRERAPRSVPEPRTH
ncbi:hypothetical protein ACKI1I_20500 [Streptomyces turgidiscabies]|uniref:Uncharacterized protein n=1 Tax=Streptomyces turgidiscabies (strain Car8) TaxID=698760 RepID=L7FG23_STRT8|nr:MULTISPECIES: hypothetical protein [Streptomyces]ELP70109.1 hypothetical protein STRTUCAR8_10147 [Streptomyces turgidiscabies Car8]MDX3496696.1 hypothetical protein [Streptomyces turgidiscabies]GAQ72899.1 hypothetical protein T45_04655 [Streptomyces turgidiscabies]